MLAAMTPSRPRLAAAVAGLLLTVTACGGGSGDDDAAAKAIADSIMEAQGDAGGGTADLFQMKQEEADCIGEGFVDEIGTDKLKDYGLLNEDLEASGQLTDKPMSTEDAEAAADTLLGCADVQQMMSAAMGEVDAKTKECLEEVLTDDALKSLFVKLFSGKEDEAGQELVQPMMECAAP